MVGIEKPCQAVNTGLIFLQESRKGTLICNLQSRLCLLFRVPFLSPNVLASFRHEQASTPFELKGVAAEDVKDEL